MEIYLVNFIPNYCPKCGKIMHMHTTESIRDFQSHASYNCLGCGVKYQYAEQEYLLDAAKNAGGDLHQYVK